MTPYLSSLIKIDKAAMAYDLALGLRKARLFWNEYQDARDEYELLRFARHDSAELDRVRAEDWRDDCRKAFREELTRARCAYELRRESYRRIAA